LLALLAFSLLSLLTLLALLALRVTLSLALLLLTALSLPVGLGPTLLALPFLLLLVTRKGTDHLGGVERISGLLAVAGQLGLRDVFLVGHRPGARTAAGTVSVL